MAPPVKPIPDGYSAVTPYLICAGAADAIDFYKRAFGAEESFRMNAPDGRVGHAEIRIGGAVIMLADEHPEIGARGPRSIGGSPVGIMLYVDDVDATVARAADAGATVTRPVETQFYGDRMGGITDPFGHVWHIGTHVEDVSPDEIARRAAQKSGQGG
ncbi:VOC family protein [Piscinibacter koreensis]|uniref:VOC family protein n=1 Tax=Piscinibacter koreensis TaxID=2742824 RepID=A0A7Y6TWE7_9BURK|nr:VOC family protein [Schlegelella koreensis]